MGVVAGGVLTNGFCCACSKDAGNNRTAERMRDGITDFMFNTIGK
jgi:uncharacterized protein YneR